MALEKAFAQGYDVILEIDWQGARQVRAKVPECISIFILPPSRVALEQRLRARRTDGEDVIQRRLRDAVEDMTHYEEFDYTIVNDDFATALADLRRIVAGPAPDLASDRPGLAPLLTQLLGGPPPSA
jgi:guanylate kinase